MAGGLQAEGRGVVMATNVSFACGACGATYRASANLAGRVFRCKRCGQSIAVKAADPTDALFEADRSVPHDPDHAAAGETDTYALAEVPSASTANRPIAPGAAVSTFSPSPASGSPSTFQPAVSPGDPKASRKRRKRRKPGGVTVELDRWLLGAAMLAVGVLLPLAYFVTAVRVFVLVVVLLIGTGMAIAGNLAIADRVLDEDIFLFWLLLVIPYYSVYYLVTRWNDIKGPFLVSTAGYTLVVVSLLLLRFTAT